MPATRFAIYAAALLTAMALPRHAPGLTAQGGGLALEATPLAGGLDRPLAIVDPGDGSGRLFIAEQTGEIRIWTGATLRPTPFLDLGGSIACCGERGLLGLALHPDYAGNGLFFVSYSDTGGDTVISRFSVSADPDVADAGSELVLLTQPQPAANHNNGNLAFGPDGYLYIGMGDGGPGNDPDDRGQDLGSLLGKILRIDVDHPDPPLPYGIPDDNPFVGIPGARDEIWARGLRNPWRFSFDRATGDLFLGDVGQGALEEIDHQPAASPGGENYGWRLMEGSSCFDPPEDCNDGSLTLPILEYEHTLGCSVTGGFRYRGSAHPRLRGVYLYGDFCFGTIWGTVPRCDGAWESVPLLASGLAISSFGEDAAGELYVVHLANAPDGEVRRLALAAGSGGPALVPGPESVEFGPVEVGALASLPLTLTHTNAGAEALTIEQLSTSDPGRFTLDLAAGAAPCGPPPVCLTPGASCTLEVDFSSSTVGAFGETLTATGNFDPVSVPLEAIAYNDCPHDVTLEVSDRTIDAPEEFAACAEVVVGPNVTVAAGGVATLVAGARVSLGNGVSVLSGGSLLVEIDPLLAPEP